MGQSPSGGPRKVSIAIMAPSAAATKAAKRLPQQASASEHQALSNWHQNNGSAAAEHPDGKQQQSPPSQARKRKGGLDAAAHPPLPDLHAAAGHSRAFKPQRKAQPAAYVPSAHAVQLPPVRRTAAAMAVSALRQEHLQDHSPDAQPSPAADCASGEQRKHAVPPESGDGPRKQVRQRTEKAAKPWWVV